MGQPRHSRGSCARLFPEDGSSVPAVAVPKPHGHETAKPQAGDRDTRSRDASAWRTLTGVELPGNGDATDLRVAEAQKEGPVGLVDEQVVRLLLVDEAQDGPRQSRASGLGARARQHRAGRLLPVIPVRLQMLLQHLHDPIKPLPEGIIPPRQVFLLKSPENEHSCRQPLSLCYTAQILGTAAETQGTPGGYAPSSPPARALGGLRTEPRPLTRLNWDQDTVVLL